MNKIHEIFPLIVYQGIVNGHEEFKKNNLDLLKDYWFDPYVNESPEYSGKIFVHHQKKFKSFFESLKNNLNEYFAHLNVNYNLLSYHIVKSWVGAHKDDTTPALRQHYHNESNISFVYYLKTDESSDKFCVSQSKNKNESVEGLFETSRQRNIIDKFNRYNCNYYTINPIEGSVILFPSDTLHSTQKFTTRKSERIVIAGDIRITLNEKNSNYQQGTTHPSLWLEL